MAPGVDSMAEAVAARRGEPVTAHGPKDLAAVIFRDEATEPLRDEAPATVPCDESDVQLNAQTTIASSEDDAAVSKSFECLAVELVIDIMEQMCPKDLSNFALTNKHVFGIFKENQAKIMTDVLKKTPELETMLYLCTANERDLIPGRMLHPRKIDFIVKAIDNNDTTKGQKAKVSLMAARVAFNDGKLICPEKIEFGIWHLVQVWNLIKTIDWWVDMYPSLRWRDNPEDRRCLRSDEEARLRKAIARWWLYGHYFHGVYWRESQAPKKWQQDMRLHQMRLLSTHELRELDDLSNLLYETISKDLCSSPERVRHGEWYTIELVPWGGDDGRHSDIVNTYLKLNPDHLKHLLSHYGNRGKGDIIRFASQHLRAFNLDRETLSMSINTVLQERIMVKPNGVTDIPRMGIIDDDRPNGEVIALWANDSSPNGKPPLTWIEIAAFPRERTKRVAWGDDGDVMAGLY